MKYSEVVALIYPFIACNITYDIKEIYYVKFYLCIYFLIIDLINIKVVVNKKDSCATQTTKKES